MYFIDWCASNYYSSGRVIMDAAKSNIICHVNALVVQYSLTVTPTFTQNREEFSEEDLIQFFRHATIKQKHPFFLKSYRSDISLDNQPFPLDVNLFNDETQIIVSMMSQFLGLDIDGYIP